MSRLILVHDDGRMEEFSPAATNKVRLFVAISFYLKKHTIKKSKATRTNEKNYFSLLNEFLISRSMYDVSDATPEAMQDYQEHLAKSRSAATVNRHFQTIRNFFNVHRKKRALIFNPCDDVPHLKIEKPRVQTWTEEDFKTLLEHCPPHTKDILTFIWLTGCRSCEVINLTWIDIDHEANIRFRSKKNSNDYRDFPIDNELSKFIHTLPLNGLYVFNGFTADSLGKLVRKTVLEHCKNKSVTVKGLRHTFCKRLLQSGRTRPVVQQLMGHKDWRTTEEYKHFDSDFLSKQLSESR